MKQNTVAIILGGLLPAFFMGFSGALGKASTDQGIGSALYTLIRGLATAAVGIIFFMLYPDKTISFRSGMYAVTAGTSFGIGISLVAVALNGYGAKISQIAPIYSTNNLVTACIGLWLYSEWKEVNLHYLIAGALLIFSGVIIIGKA